MRNVEQLYEIRLNNDDEICTYYGNIIQNSIFEFIAVGNSEIALIYPVSSQGRDQEKTLINTAHLAYSAWFNAFVGKFEKSSFHIINMLLGAL